jgi:hypothetical protein
MPCTLLLWHSTAAHKGIVDRLTMMPQRPQLQLCRQMFHNSGIATQLHAKRLSFVAYLCTSSTVTNFQ